MIKEAIATGATVEEAIANAKAALGAPIDAQVEVAVLEMPKKKVLGLFGGAPAKAKASYDAPEEKKPAKAAKPAPAPKKEAAPVKTEAPAAKEAAKAQEPAPERKKIEINSKPSLETAVSYLKEIVTGMGVQAVEVEAYEASDNEIILELDCGEDYGIVIGRRGDTLDAIQYLTRLAAGRKKAEDDYSRISINVGNYREKRKQTLAELAKKNAEKVLKYGRNVTFEPMNPYERRIIHTTVQEIEGVTSHSVGSDSDRRVVITLEDGVKPTHPSKGGYNNRGRGGNRGGRGGRSNGGRPRNNYAPKSDAPQRAPKTDAGASGVSLYGKIN